MRMNKAICPHCGETLEISSEDCGKVIQCAKCGKAFSHRVELLSFDQRIKLSMKAGLLFLLVGVSFVLIAIWVNHLNLSEFGRALAGVFFPAGMAALVITGAINIGRIMIFGRKK